MMRAGVVALLILATGGAARADTIERRGGEPIVSGTVIRMDDAGVTIEAATGEQRLIAWDRVRDVDVAGPWQAELREFMPIADDLWRARSRLQRRDTALSEPLFEELFERYEGQTHETALIVAEGLLRCRIARDETEAAVIPALEVARLFRAGVETTRYSALPSVMDERTSLCPFAPPFWMYRSDVARLQRSLDDYDAQGDTVIAAMASLYMQSTALHLGDAAELEQTEEALSHPGVEFLRTALHAAFADDRTRRSARESLRRQIRSPVDGTVVWMGAWANVASGLGMLRDAPIKQQLSGMVNLLNLPARSEYAPYRHLIALALDRVALAYESMDKSDAADRVREELRRRFVHYRASDLQPPTAQETTNKEPA